VRRLGLIVGGAITAVMFLAGSAFAAAGSYPPPVTTPAPAPTADPGTGIAFTGANISLGLIILVTLLVTGLVLLLAGRRRQPRATR
jgi:hypothetical protein